MPYAKIELFAVYHILHKSATPGLICVNEDLHLIHILTGSIKLWWNEQKHHVGPGGIVYLPPLTEYDVSAARGGVEMINFHFQLAIEKDIPFENQYRFPLVFGIPDFSWIKGNLFEMHKNWAGGSPAGLVRATGMAGELLSHYFETQTLLPVRTTRDDLMNELKRRLTEDRSDFFDARKWADTVALSVSQMNRRFRAAFETTPCKYWQTCRLNLARHMLARNNLAVSMIARRCGMKDPNYFSRWFKTATGFSPLNYRQQPSVL
jgi:AraC-like DNA-binding protein